MRLRYAYGKYTGQDPDPNIRSGCIAIPRRALRVSLARASVHAADAKCDRLLQRRLHFRWRHECQRFGRDCAVVACTSDRIFNRVVLCHQSNCLIKITIADLAISERPIPESALAFRAASE